MLRWLYMAGLFAIAWWGDRTKLYPDNPRWRPLIYSFALGVYGSSWTFYGAVGTAKQDGLLYIAGYFGPLVLLAFGIRFYERLVRLAKHQNATSISDFLSARFGRSRRIAVLVTIIALTAIIPYIALQLTAISMSIDVLTGKPPGVAPHWYSDTTLGVALMLAVFAILFGTRGIDATEHHPGMVLAIAAESVFKLLALVVVAVFALTTLDSPEPMLTALRQLPEEFTQPSMFFAQAVTAHVRVLLPAAAVPHRRRRMRGRRRRAARALVVRRIPRAAQHRGHSHRRGFVAARCRGPQRAQHRRAGVVDSTVGRAGVARAVRVSRRLLRGHRHGHRRERRAGDHDQQRPGAADAVALAVAAVGESVASPAIDPVGAPRGHRRRLVRRLRRSSTSRRTRRAWRPSARCRSPRWRSSRPRIIAAVYWPGASRAGVTGGLAAGFVIWMYTLLVPPSSSAGGTLARAG